MSNNLNQDLVIGLDAGGTRTRAVLAAADGPPLGEGAAGPGNALTVAVPTLTEHLAEAIAEAVPESLRGRVVAVAGGFAGATAASPDEPGHVNARAALTAALRRLGIATGSVRICSDIEAAFASAPGTPADGLALVAGTGAVAMRITGRRGTTTVDGDGWLLGDDGSGFWIGRAAVRAALRMADGRGPATTLAASVGRALGLPAAALPPGAVDVVPRGAEGVRAQSTGDEGRALHTIGEGRALGTGDEGRLQRTGGEGRLQRTGGEGRLQRTADEGRPLRTIGEGRTQHIADDGRPPRAGDEGSALGTGDEGRPQHTAGDSRPQRTSADVQPQHTSADDPPHHTSTDNAPSHHTATDNAPPPHPTPNWPRPRREAYRMYLLPAVMAEPPIRLARFAPLVAEAARGKDPVAEAILEEAAGQLAEAVRALDPRPGEPLVATGGLLGPDGPLTALLTGRLAALGLTLGWVADGCRGAVALARLVHTAAADE
ncbi:BadF/BadG/BcrA/BcrD ATPase family protein [Streptomyces sp. NPDC050619]|uniref:BadF/BadG/BcrA/BcrD ATPase family protein n=1 Tax=Streptomyces sp. NPDC050619 TaxID=3157214 RepID=UPI003447A491